ncbi:MAG: nitrophenyl compound nitroreductase subunit ArsF family protein [Nanobdellota archaeon]
MRKIFFIFVFLLIAGCTGNAEQVDNTGNAVDDTSERTVNIDKLEVYHFHGDNQCQSCITLGDYAEETVNTYFSDELDEGTIVFDHINGQKPENRELARKYGATGSSLWLGVYDDGSFKAEQNKKVWYKLQDKQEYMDYLKGVIEKKLAGE